MDTTVDLPSTFLDFLEFVRDQDSAVPSLSPKRFSEAVNVELQTLAEQAHVHRNTVTRAPGSKTLQEFLREALRVIRAANDLTGDLPRALFWYRMEPLSVFGYKTAERLVGEGRTEDVLHYIESLHAGPAG